MAERKPTPGPWHARQDRHSGEWRVVCWDETEVPDEDAPWIVCDVAGLCADGNEESNARLIAAAPSMFEALAECITTMEHARVFVNSRERIKQPEGSDLYDEALAKARAALSRAKGDT